MSDIGQEFDEQILAAAFGPGWRSRCDYCGWPLAESAERGCVVDNCSQRPRPLAHLSEVMQYVRRMEAKLAARSARP